MAAKRRGWTAVWTATALLIALAAIGLMTVADYFGSQPFALHWPQRRAPHYSLAAVYWSGDMGMRLGGGQGIVDGLRAKGIPVLSVSSPMLFGSQRDRAFVDRTVAASLTTALERSGAERIAVIGSAFGADIVGSGLGHVTPNLRRRIASVVLVVPGTDVYFRANPSGIFYTGPAAADPEHTIPLLHGLPVTCIAGREDDASLCRLAVMDGAHRVDLSGGRFSAVDTDLAVSAVGAAVLHPPAPMR